MYSISTRDTAYAFNEPSSDQAVSGACLLPEHVYADNQSSDCLPQHNCLYARLLQFYIPALHNALESFSASNDGAIADVW
jgi:hypothetical protein